jgi:hypothetical protein
MAHLDLDAKRAARAEAENAPHEVVLGGETFTLPPRIPLECLDLVQEGDFRAAFRLLLDDEEALIRFLAHRPDDEDLAELLGLYGEPGESAASPVSSANGGRQPKQTSRRPTTSTSRRHATANSNAAPAGS